MLVLVVLLPNYASPATLTPSDTFISLFYSFELNSQHHFNAFEFQRALPSIPKAFTASLMLVLVNIQSLLSLVSFSFPTLILQAL